MTFTKKNVKMPSSDGVHTLRGMIFVPDGEIKGIVHVVHGMTEHIKRYTPLFTALAENGFIAAGYDNLGHGETANDDSELGFIANKKGYRFLVDDVGAFGEKLRKNHKGIPYILMGHSMGSFIARLAAEKFGKNTDRLIICGTGGPNKAAPFGLLVADAAMLIKGKKGYSDLIENLAFGAYNKGFEGNSKYDWLTKDTDIIEIYKNDKFCTFRFTVSAMHDLVKLNFLANRCGWFKHLRKDMPVLMISGDKDPVGAHGKGVTAVYKKLLKTGHGAVTLKLYENCRHEILNDTCKETVIADILEFINR